MKDVLSCCYVINRKVGIHMLAVPESCCDTNVAYILCIASVEAVAAGTVCYAPRSYCMGATVFSAV